MSIVNDSTSTERVPLSGMLEEFRTALEDEISKIKKSGQSSTILLNGREIPSHSTDKWYLFNVDYAPSLPADTPCKLLVGQIQFEVTVVSFDENSIILASRTTLPDSLGKVRLENGATLLMERLIKCIEENATKENGAGMRMLSTSGNVYAARKRYHYDNYLPKYSNTASQNEAIRSALTNDITYIWGPPGTGKTTVIGQIIEELYSRNRSVLVLSHTNTAVDGAIEKAFKEYSSRRKKHHNCPILRLGTPSKSLPDSVLLSKHMEILGKELYQEKTDVEQQIAIKRKSIGDREIELAKYKFVYENKHDEIKNALDTKEQYEVLAKPLDQKISDIRQLIQRERESSPTNEEEVALASQLSETEQTLQRLLSQVQGAEQNIERIKSKTASAQAEQEKCSEVEKLRDEEAGYPSLAALRFELNICRDTIDRYETKTQELIESRDIYQNIITTYVSKNNIAKLFQKQKYENAQFQLEKSNRQLKEVESSLQQERDKERIYFERIKRLLQIQEQLQSKKIAHPKEYWANEIVRLQRDLTDAIQNRNRLHKSYVDTKSEGDILKTRQDNYRKRNEKVAELEKQLCGVLENRQMYTNAINHENEALNILLDKEKMLCATFSYIIKANTSKEIYEELTNLICDLQPEVKELDGGKLKECIQKDYELFNNLKKQLDQINLKLAELERQAIENAKVIGTTLTKSYLNDNIRSREYDTVILDEASMAAIPALWCAGYLAKNNVIIVGDFLQLPPIAMAETPLAKKWLGKDIFYHSKMLDLIGDRHRRPSNFVMLNEQFRMEADIADIANMYYGQYGGLKSKDASQRRNTEREKFYRWYSDSEPGQNIHMIDTESLHAWATGVPQAGGHSRMNFFSAAVDVTLAFELIKQKLESLNPKTAEPVEESLVLIIAPYKPHIAHINRLIELEYSKRGFQENLNYIKAGTVHSFQGSEADIVLFDLVIDEPHYRAGLFIEEKQTPKFDGVEINNSHRKLFNVAITRARFKLYVVGNFAFCQKKAKNNALADLLSKLKESNAIKREAKSILPNITFSKSSRIELNESATNQSFICREDSFFDYFLQDIHSIKRRLIIYSPFIANDRLSILLPVFADVINRGKQIIVVTKASSDRGKRDNTTYVKLEKELKNIGVTVIHKKGMHEKLVFIDSSAVWVGSLNALSFNGLTGEIMHRLSDPSIVANYEKLVCIDHLCEVVDRSYEQKCPICKDGEMILREGDDGVHFWKCVNEDYSRSAIQPYPIDGIIRCKCGAPYIFSMKKEPRWVCTANNRHFQKMQKADLSLEKMAALIPSPKVRIEVERFFEQKQKTK